MDEREMQIITEEQGSEEGRESTKRGKKKGILIGTAILALLFICCGAAVFVFRNLPEKGYEEYTVQKEQYYVEYSEEYDYWDVITVEYPVLSEIDQEVQEQLNQLMYDTAMDRVTYWHLSPSDEVKGFQEEHFSIFASDVNCDIPFHSQYLLCADFKEYYSAGNPVWMTNGTERALTLDLMTGERYELTDILEVNKEFITRWDRSMSDELGEEYADDEMLEYVLSWFLQSNEDINEKYVCNPFFYVTEDKNFVIGVSLDPILEYAYTGEPLNRSYYAELTPEEIEPFKKESEFWNKYEKSVAAGEVLPCKDKKENIWLGENASVWDWEY